MSTIKVQKNKENQNNYTKIDISVVQDPNLSFKAKGLYCGIKCSQYKIFCTLNFISDIKDGIETIQSALNELEKSGYIKKSINNVNTFLLNDVEETLYEDYGYIYIFGDNYGNYKIGKTNDLFKRYRTYLTHLPYPPIIVRLILSKNMSKTEKELHKLFASKNINREWFKLSKNDLNTVNNYKTTDIVEVK